MGVFEFARVAPCSFCSFCCIRCLLHPVVVTFSIAPAALWFGLLPHLLVLLLPLLLTAPELYACAVQPLDPC